MAADASIVLSLLDPPPGHHWGIEMPDAMNASIDDPASMLRKMAGDPGRDAAERMALADAREAVPVAMRMAVSAGQVVAGLTAEGMDLVGHFLDTDGNDGQYLRMAAEKWTEEYL